MMMKRVQIARVDGRKAYTADDKCLHIIGNKTVYPKEFVWTDGRCIYGSQSTYGSSPVIIENRAEEIPLLIGRSGTIEGNQYGSYSVKKGVKVFGSGENHNGMVNTDSRFFLVDNDEEQGRYWNDVNMDSKGNIYQIDCGDSTYFHDPQITTGTGTSLFVNDSFVSSVELQSFMEDVKAAAEARVGNVGKGDCTARSINGRIFSADDYWLIVHAVGTAHKYIDYYPHLTLGSLTCYIVRRWLVTPSTRTLIYEESVYCHGWPEDNWGWDCDIDYSPPQVKEVRLPLGGGYYYILGGNPIPCITTTPHKGVSVFFVEYGGYTAYIYSPEGELIATLSKETTGFKISASNHISLCKLKGNKYLIGIKGNGLFTAQNGILTSLDTVVHNWRLCPMKNIKPWKNEPET